jgi:hypothetical protein
MTRDCFFLRFFEVRILQKGEIEWSVGATIVHQAFGMLDKCNAKSDGTKL